MVCPVYHGIPVVGKYPIRNSAKNMYTVNDSAGHRSIIFQPHHYPVKNTFGL